MAETENAAPPVMSETRGEGQESALPRYRQFHNKDRFGGYSPRSVLWHWATVIAAVIIVATAVIEGLEMWHQSAALVLAPFIIVRIVRRFLNGLPRLADQLLLLNFISRITILMLLISLFLLAITGLIWPFFAAVPYTLPFVGSFKAGYLGDAVTADVLLSIHKIAGTVLIYAIGVHLLIALKHLLEPGRAIFKRIVIPIKDGK